MLRCGRIRFVISSALLECVPETPLKISTTACKKTRKRSGSSSSLTQMQGTRMLSQPVHKRETLPFWKCNFAAEYLMALIS